MSVIAEQAAPAAKPRFNNLGLALKQADQESLKAFFAALLRPYNPNGRKAAEIRTCLESPDHPTRYDAVKHLKRLGVTNKVIEDAARDHLNN